MKVSNLKQVIAALVLGLSLPMSALGFPDTPLTDPSTIGQPVTNLCTNDECYINYGDPLDRLYKNTVQYRVPDCARGLFGFMGCQINFGEKEHEQSSGVDEGCAPNGGCVIRLSQPPLDKNEETVDDSPCNVGISPLNPCITNRSPAYTHFETNGRVYTKAQWESYGNDHEYQADAAEKQRQREEEKARKREEEKARKRAQKIADENAAAEAREAQREKDAATAAAQYIANQKAKDNTDSVNSTDSHRTNSSNSDYLSRHQDNFSLFDDQEDLRLKHELKDIRSRLLINAIAMGVTREEFENDLDSTAYKYAMKQRLSQKDNGQQTTAYSDQVIVPFSHYPDGQRLNRQDWIDTVLTANKLNLLGGQVGYSRGPTHRGTDLANWSQTTNYYGHHIGTVTDVKPDTENGWRIFVTTTSTAGDTFDGVYLHITHPKVSQGDRVRPGQLLGYGYVKNPKFASAGDPHVHWQLRMNGELVDPIEGKIYWEHLGKDGKGSDDR